MGIAWVRFACCSYFIEMSDKEKKLSSVENFAVGAMVGITSVMVSVPIEHVKLLLQNQNEILKVCRLQSPYKGIIDCAMWIYRTEGIMIIRRLMVNFHVMEYNYSVYIVHMPWCKCPCFLDCLAWLLLHDVFCMAIQFILDNILVSLFPECLYVFKIQGLIYCKLFYQCGCVETGLLGMALARRYVSIFCRALKHQDLK